LRGRLVVNLFYESLHSYALELRPRRQAPLGRHDGRPLVRLLVDKGESLRDTSLTLGEYDPM
jgi:hypothetical protein